MKHWQMLLFVIWLVSCGSSTHDRENYGAITSTQLTSQAQHRQGWGRRDCLVCHNVGNIHRDPNSPVDSDSIAEMARNGGQGICLQCHSPNGITP